MSLIDLDPLNVFFWLFLGVMFGIRPLPRPKRAGRGQTAEWPAPGWTVSR